MLFRSFIGHRASNIRADVPCLTHGDANLLNITVAEQVTLIDCDFTAIRYLLAELSALDEHVYLTAGIGLPPAFFAGYGRAVPADLLLHTAGSVASARSAAPNGSAGRWTGLCQPQRGGASADGTNASLSG
jgi:hypothetical protein